MSIYPDEMKMIISSFLHWLSKYRFVGPLVLIIALIVATVLLLPGTVITLGTGVALMKAYENTWLALLVGSISVFVGTWVGSIIALLIARYLFREQAVRCAMKYKFLTAIDKAIEIEGFKLMFLMRLCPLIPFNIQNYVMGVTSIKIAHYAVGGLGMLPFIVIIVFFGTTISDIHDAVNGDLKTGPIHLISMIVGGISLLALFCFMSRIIHRYLKETI